MNKNSTSKGSYVVVIFFFYITIADGIIFVICFKLKLKYKGNFGKNRNFDKDERSSQWRNGVYLGEAKWGGGRPSYGGGQKDGNDFLTITFIVTIKSQMGKPMGAPWCEWGAWRGHALP